MSQPKGSIFVTGGSGFIAYHIVHHLLNDGYHVRTTARGPKVEKLRNALAIVFDPSRFEVVDVPDIAAGDFSEILKDIDGIIHTAYPVVEKPDFDLAVRTAVEGSLHIVREGVKAGVRKYVMTSSLATFNMEGSGFGIHDYYTSSAEEAASAGNPGIPYRYAKALSDRKILEFQDEHPEIDITILGPSWVYGPFPPGFEDVIPQDVHAISTNLHVYSLLAKNSGHCLPPFPGYVDVRDVARVHVLALKSRPTSEVGHKRFLVISPHDSPWAVAVARLAEERPELKDRLLDATDVPVPQFGNSVVGVQPDGLERAVGFKPSDYTKWEVTILDTVDSLLSLERAWKTQGFDAVVPTISLF